MKTNLQNSAQSGSLSFFDLKNPFLTAKSQTDTGRFYKEAREALKPLPYAERNRLLFDLCRYSANIYHVLSVMLGLATAYLVATVGSGIYYAAPDDVVIFVVIALLFFILITLLLVATEFFKSNSAAQVFKSLATGDKVHITQTIALFACMSLSVALSGIGGAYITKLTSTHTEGLKSQLMTKQDSLNQFYASEIEKATLTAETYFSRNNYHGVITWTRGGEIAKRYESLQNDVQTLKDEQRQAIKDLKHQYAGLIASNSQTSWQNAIIAFVLIFFLEITTLLCYRFKFLYQASTLQEGLSRGVVRPWTITSQQKTVSVPYSPNEQTLSGTHGMDGNRLGFRFGNTQDANRHQSIPPAPPSVQFRDNNGQVRNGFLIVCLHCGKEAIKLSSQAKFCCESHKKAYHRQK